MRTATLVGVQSGEFPLEGMADAIAAVIERDRQRGVLAPGPDPARPDEPSPRSALSFPTRVLGEGQRMWVSDAGHGRVCELEAQGAARWRIAATWTGLVEPQGLARLGGQTFVADRRGHSVYRLEADGAFVRVAGTGRLGEWRLAPGPANDLDLRSPWGLAPLPDGDLAVAMAGSHQLWRLERDPSGTFDHSRLALLAGAGGEELLDGPAENSLLAQPTGLALEGSVVAFADAESSAVRLLDTTGPAVSTVVGTGLFDFGDRDGSGDHVLLQHAEDIAWRDGELVVADTYNDRLKVVDPSSRRCEAHPGEAGEAGALWEPIGVSARDGDLLVADTNNHRIVTVTRDGSISPIEIEEQD